MVKLTSPLHSINASGSIAHAICYARHGPRNIARLARTPRNPNTLPQRARRAMMIWLAGQWHLLTPTQQATWSDLAHSYAITTYNAYLGYNLRRWTHHRAPSKTYPALYTGTFPTTYSFSATTIRHRVLISLSCSVAANGWGMPVYQVPTDGTNPTPQMLITVLPIPAGFLTEWLSWTYQPGTYKYKYRRFTTAGRLDNYVSPVATATVLP